MTRKYFGTDGVRGRVGEAPITPEFVMRLGYAAGKVLARKVAGSDRPAVLIGKDTRISGYMLEAAMEAGFSAAGVDVLLCGPMPTPAVAYLTRALRLSAGIVISASHNAYPDNGIKFFSADGGKLADTVEQEIEAALERPLICQPAAELGRARRIEDAPGRYIEFCKSTFPNALDLRGLRVVVDCAHGASYHVAPPVFHELGAEVITIGNTPNGLNINDGFGATQPAALVRTVLERGADVGIALDGDGDRVVMSDASGRVFDGDQLLYVIAMHRARRGTVAGVAGTLMSNFALEKALADRGIAFGRANVGDRYVIEMLQQRGWLVGGENSGHLICLDKHTTGDGIVSALQVLTAIREEGQPLDALAGALRLYPQILINVRVARGFDWQGSDAIEDARRGAEARLNGRGRILLRPSGTEPLLRVMVEGEDEEEVKGIASDLARRVEEAAAAEMA